jgi:hypothetical protein
MIKWFKNLFKEKPSKEWVEQNEKSKEHLSGLIRQIGTVLVEGSSSVYPTDSWTLQNQTRLDRQSNEENYHTYVNDQINQKYRHCRVRVKSGKGLQSVV